MLNPIYKPGTLLSVGRPPDHPEVVCPSIVVPPDAYVAGAVRIVMPLEEAQRMALALLDAVSMQRQRAEVRDSHALRSSGKSSVDGSPTPTDAVCPPASWSSADCAVGNGPSKQSSSNQSRQPAEQ